MTDFIGISNHAADRCRERMGIPRRAVRRVVRKAWFEGGSALPDVLSRMPYSSAHAYKIHAGHIFVFERVTENDYPQLVTVIPNKWRDEDRDGFKAERQFHAFRQMRRNRSSGEGVVRMR